MSTLSAPLWRRFAAMIYDFLLVVAISMAYGLAIIGITVLIKGAPEPGHRFDWGNFNFLVVTGWIVCIIYFFCFFWNKSGQTLGMKSWKLQVVNDANQYPSYQQSVIRCLIAPFSFFIFGIGYWWAFTNPEKQTLHEKLSNTKTILIKDN